MKRLPLAQSFAARHAGSAARQRRPAQYQPQGVRPRLGRGFATSQQRRLALEPLEARQLLSLTHWYTFNEGTGDDLVGAADIALVGGATVIGGQAFMSNVGVDSGEPLVQYLNLPTSALPAAGSATVVAWFTTANAENWARVFDIGNQSGTSGDSYFFFSPQTSTGESRLVLTPGGIPSERIAATAPSDDGVAHMVAGVVDAASDTLRLYLDGAAVATAPLAGAHIGSVTKAVAYFGRSLYDGDPGFTGSIDEIRIYDEAVGASQIAADYAAGPVPTPPPEPTGAARQVEALDRGVVAVRRSSSEIYVGWRLLGTDAADVAFNLYRSSNGGAPVKLNSAPVTQTTDWVDNTAPLTQTNEYFVRAVTAGIELAASGSFSLGAFAPIQQYLNVPLQIPAGGMVPDHQNPGEFLSYGYNANDASVGDLDGDGQYEIVLKWDPTNAKDNSQAGYTGNVYVDAYELDGTLKWRIDLGRNMRAGAHYSPFIVYDLDGDGKAEVVMRTAEATVDGTGAVIGSATADYRNSSGYVLAGPEYYTVFEGETGAIIDSAPFAPVRGSVSSWGDNYGNRVDRFQATVAYLDGVRPSIVINRGYAGPQSGLSARNEVAAFDFRDGELTQRWLFAAATNGQHPDYVGQTAHSITTGDVDGDGRDEIITGAAAIDDDGTLLHNTHLGHGDALHMSDMIPWRDGLEVFMPHEGAAFNGNVGASIRDAETGEIIFSLYGSGDIGRGVAADIDPNHLGYEYWATTSDPGESRKIYNSSGQAIYDTPSNMFYNFLVWWDADLSRELLDGTTISNWNSPGRSNFDLNPAQGGTQQFAPNASSNNGSKSTPALSADILGDWREEVIWRRSDNTALEIFTTIIPASNRLVTLMHDTQYRAAIAWQNSGYNQPPHPSFHLGAGMSEPPAPNIYAAGSSALAGDYDLGGSVATDDLDIWAQTYGSTNGYGYLPGDGDGDNAVDGGDFLLWQRNLGQGQAQTSVAAEVGAPASVEAAAVDAALADLADAGLTSLAAADVPGVFPREASPPVRSRAAEGLKPAEQRREVFDQTPVARRRAFVSAKATIGNDSAESNVGSADVEGISDLAKAFLLGRAQQ